jgi:hypothetical protein
MISAVFFATALFIIYFLILKFFGELRPTDWQPFCRLFQKKPAEEKES